MPECDCCGYGYYVDTYEAADGTDVRLCGWCADGRCRHCGSEAA